MERMSLLDRGPTDTVIALALLHHLAITNNVPLEKLAEFFASLGRSLIVEYIPRDDPKVQRLLALRNHSFPGYCREGFEKAFAKYFSTYRNDPIANSGRRLVSHEELESCLAPIDGVVGKYIQPKLPASKKVSVVLVKSVAILVELYRRCVGKKLAC